MALESDKRLFTFDYAELGVLEIAYMFGLCDVDNSY